MELYTLIENTSSRQDIKAEHGLSLYLETGNCHILFDTGQSGAFADNARKMDIDLTTIDICIISHGHYDHGGGIRRFLSENTTAPVYINEYGFQPCFSGTEKYIGLDQELLQTDRIILVPGNTSLGPGITICTMPDISEPVHSQTDNRLYTVYNGSLIPDSFRHEQYLLIQENTKRILLSGCAHKGIINIMEYFKPDIMIGGFHFMKTPLNKAGIWNIQQAAKKLCSYHTQFYTGHCTGTEHFKLLQEIMGNSIHYLSGGTHISV